MVQQQQQQPFYSPLSGTTQVSQYQKKHSPIHHPDHHPIFISFFHLLRSIASSPFKLVLWNLNLIAQPLSTSSLVYLLVWSPPPHIPYMVNDRRLRLCSSFIGSASNSSQYQTVTQQCKNHQTNWKQTKRCQKGDRERCKVKCSMGTDATTFTNNVPWHWDRKGSYTLECAFHNSLTLSFVAQNQPASQILHITDSLSPSGQHIWTVIQTGYSVLITFYISCEA